MTRLKNRRGTRVAVFTLTLASLSAGTVATSGAVHAATPKPTGIYVGGARPSGIYVG